MIRVHVWRFRGLKTAMGHASMHVGSEYISWWPEGGPQREFKIPTPVGRKVPLYRVAHIHGQSFADDQLYEAVNDFTEQDRFTGELIDGSTGLPLKPLPPDRTVQLDGLDEGRIVDWWKSFNVPGRQWNTFGQNCATTVARGLMVGGADDYALGSSGWWHSWNLIWHPNDVLRYAHQVSIGLAARAGRHAAINFVRRFCTSPFGFTSVTASMDERGLAEALYAEASTNTSLVRSVFEELNERHNTDADDVAEIYVNLLRTKKGPPLGAVARDSQLKQLLIELLDTGSTSAGEKECIGFLKSLQ